MVWKYELLTIINNEKGDIKSLSKSKKEETNKSLYRPTKNSLFKLKREKIKESLHKPAKKNLLESKINEIKKIIFDSKVNWNRKIA